MEWEDESFVAWFGVGLVQEVDAFFQLAYIEHVVKAGVCVGDDVEDDVPVVLEGVHMMVDDHCLSEVLGLHLFAGFSVNQVDQSLIRETVSERSQSFLPESQEVNTRNQYVKPFCKAVVEGYTF